MKKTTKTKIDNLLSKIRADREKLVNIDYDRSCAVEEIIYQAADKFQDIEFKFVSKVERLNDQIELRLANIEALINNDGTN